ncbi:unnamed protein product [Cochlearia groenlandica]
MEDQAINQCSSSNNATESTLELKIKTLDSETYTFKVNKNETVSLFKEKIASETGVPVAQQRLIFRGRVLKDEHPLSEYHLENGHTLHLVIRQPAESQPSSDTPSQDATTNDGSGTNGGPSRNRTHVSHSVVLGSLNVGDQSEGVGPDINRVIGAVLNSFGIGGQQPTMNSTSGTYSSMPLNFSGHAPPPPADGAPGSVGGQGQAAGHSQPRQAFPGATFQASMPRVVQIPVTAATQIPIPSFLTPIPDSLDTIMEFVNQMEQALSQNGYSSTVDTSRRLPTREELSRNRRGGGPATPEELSVAMRNVQGLLSGLAVSSLSHIAGRLEQDGSSTDPSLRSQIQTEAVQAGLAMQHLGALLLELGRTILTLRMSQSPEQAYVNAGPAVYISPSGPNPIMVQPFPNQSSPLFTGATTTANASNPVTIPVGLGAVPRHINIHIHAGTSASPVMSSVRNQQNSGGQRQQGGGEPNSNTSSAVRNIIGGGSVVAPSPHSTGENVQTGLESLVSQINATIGLVNSTQGRNQTPSGTGSLVRDTSTTPLEQPTNIVATTSTPEPSGSLHAVPTCHSDKEDATGYTTESSKKATTETTSATVTPLGLGLGGLDRKKRTKQPKTDDSSTSSASHQTVTIPHCDQPSDNNNNPIDMSNIMSQVLESPALGGLLSSVSRQTGGGIDSSSPNMLRNMLQQFTQNPQIMNTVQQIAQQVDGREIENMMSGNGQGGGGGFDLSRMVQQMMPLVSRAFSQGGGGGGDVIMAQEIDGINDNHQQQQPFQANADSMARMIEQSDPPEDVFRAMVENASMSQEELVNELCFDDALSHEYAELLRRDIEGRLKDEQSP